MEHVERHRIGVIPKAPVFVPEFGHGRRIFPHRANLRLRLGECAQKHPIPSRSRPLRGSGGWRAIDGAREDGKSVPLILRMRMSRSTKSKIGAGEVTVNMKYSEI